MPVLELFRPHAAANPVVAGIVLEMLYCFPLYVRQLSLEQYKQRRGSIVEQHEFHQTDYEASRHRVGDSTSRIDKQRNTVLIKGPPDDRLPCRIIVADNRYIAHPIVFISYELVYVRHCALCLIERIGAFNQLDFIVNLFCIQYIPNACIIRS